MAFGLEAAVRSLGPPWYHNRYRRIPSRLLTAFPDKILLLFRFQHFFGEFFRILSIKIHHRVTALAIRGPARPEPRARIETSSGVNIPSLPSRDEDFNRQQRTNSARRRLPRPADDSRSRTSVDRFDVAPARLVTAQPRPGAPGRSTRPRRLKRQRRSDLARKPAANGSTGRLKLATASSCVRPCSNGDDRCTKFFGKRLSRHDDPVSS